MIEIYALTIFAAVIRQSTTNPPQNLNEWLFLLFIFIMVNGGGIALAVKVLSDRQRVWAEQQEDKRTQAKADVQQELNITETLTQMANVLQASVNLATKTAQTADERNATQFRMANLMAGQNEYLDQLTEKVRVMTDDLKGGQTEIVSKVTERVGAAQEQNSQWVNQILAEIASLRKDFNEEMKKLLEAIGKAPTSKGHEEATKQLLEAISNLDAKFDTKIKEVESRLPVTLSGERGRETPLILPSEPITNEAKPNDG